MNSFARGRGLTWSLLVACTVFSFVQIALAKQDATKADAAAWHVRTASSPVGQELRGIAEGLAPEYD